MNFSEEQLKVINTRDKNILVSAAAGSGKTTVLVQRIIEKITDKERPVDIDRILVLTYTEAAASEMRMRIEDAINTQIKENPQDEHLVKQAMLIHNAQISTIHGFCLTLIRNDFSAIGLDPSFRVAESGEIKLVEGEVADDLIEELFEEDSEDIRLLADRFSSKNTLSGLKQIILDSYLVCRNNPFVTEYIEERKKDYECDGEDNILKTAWGEELKRYTERIIREAYRLTEYNIELVSEAGGAFMYKDALLSDKAMIEGFFDLKTYTEYRNALLNLDYARLGTKKNAEVDETQKQMSKDIRDAVKDMLSELSKSFYCMPAGNVIHGMKENSKVVNALSNVLLLYDEKLSKEKRQRKIIDFSDMEHLAIDILYKKLDGEYVPTKTALDYRDVYDEIMVDEYQDSNPVQEKILEVLSGEANKRFNRFMVGDVKQSIYSFRRACPELFMEKFDRYNDKNDQNSIRIDLCANYRSRVQVVNSVNQIFERLMDADLGNISYDSAARLYAKAEYPEIEQDNKSEIMILDKDTESRASTQEQEAKMVAQRIKEMVGKFLITDKGNIRPASYRDIVILLRSNKGWDDVFKKALDSAGIPAFISSKTGYFSAYEIKNLLNLLHILDNPLDEIALYGVLTEYFGKLNADEIAIIRSEHKEELFDAIVSTADEDTAEGSLITDDIKAKCCAFIDFITSVRKKIAYTPINELLEDIVTESGYLFYVSSMPFGDQRRSNVYMLIEKARQYESGSFKGLYHFIRYINEIRSYEIDFGEAMTVDEQADVVRIMSIHKSKGLEFPVVFICGTQKRINYQDSYESLLFERHLGIGLDYVDTKKNVKHTDIRYNVLGKSIKLETVAEELRVLYVAMTRAKEKLIMTACAENASALVDKYGMYSQMYSGSKKATLPYYVRSSISTYLDALLKACDTKVTDIRVITSDQCDEKALSEGIDRQHKKLELIRSIKDRDKITAEAKIDDIKNKIMFKYIHSDLEGLYTKTSVSELKVAAIRDKLLSGELEELPDRFFTEHESERYIPSFVSSVKKVSGTARGSAYHRVMELFDFAGTVGRENDDCSSQRAHVISVIENEVASGRLNREDADLVDVEKVITFVFSDLGKRMCLAAKRGDLYIEQPFVLGINADRLNKDFPKEENVLIQGIIDVFFEEDGKIILMDYKTDAVNSQKALTDRYALQLDFYKEALERILKKEVSEKLIYSFALEETIRLI